MISALLVRVGAERFGVPLPGVGGVFGQRQLGPAVDDADERPVPERATVEERLDSLGKSDPVAGSGRHLRFDLFDDGERLRRRGVDAGAYGGAGVLADRVDGEVTAVGCGALGAGALGHAPAGGYVVGIAEQLDEFDPGRDLVRPL